MKNILLTGIIPALTTPFCKDESIDLVAWKKWVSWHDRQSCRAAVLFGSTGEGISLTFSEKELLLKTARKCLQSTAMIVGVSAPSTDMAIVQAEQAKSLGAQAILLTTPYYVRPDQNGICQHYQKISQAIKIPIILYTVPSRTGIDLADNTIITLAQDANIVGIKDASGKIDRMEKIIKETPDSFIYLAGNDTEIIENLDRDGDGAISVLANILPNLLQSIVSNYKSNQQWAKGKFADLGLLLDELSKNGNPQVIKHMVKSTFSIASTMRLPLTNVCQETQKSIELSLRNSGIIPEEISQ